MPGGTMPGGTLLGGTMPGATMRGGTTAGIMRTGTLCLNEGDYQYRMRVDNGHFVIDHYDAGMDDYAADLVVSPSTDLGGQAFSKSMQNKLAISSPIVTSDGNILSTDGPLVLTPGDGNVIVDGNLYVKGETTYVNTQSMQVNDKTIVLASTDSPTDYSANKSGLLVAGGSFASDQERISLLWERNPMGNPFWSFLGGDLSFGKKIGQRKVAYRFVIDPVTENLQLWKTVDGGQPVAVSEFVPPDPSQQ